MAVTYSLSWVFISKEVWDAWHVQCWPLCKILSSSKILEYLYPPSSESCVLSSFGNSIPLQFTLFHRSKVSTTHFEIQSFIPNPGCKFAKSLTASLFQDLFWGIALNQPSREGDWNGARWFSAQCMLILRTTTERGIKAITNDRGKQASPQKISLLIVTSTKW